MGMIQHHAKRFRGDSDASGQNGLPSQATEPSLDFEATGDWIRLTDEDAALVRGAGRAHVAISQSASSEGSLEAPFKHSKRFVTVLEAGGKLRAFDAICYHAGGPLGLGDIEEVGENGRVCIKCPWHHYLLDLDTGSKWYQPLAKDANGKLMPAGWKSTDKSVQRIHEVQEWGDGIFLRLQVDGQCPSDSWAHREDCFRSLSDLASQHHAGKRGGQGLHGADGRVPCVSSGHVLQQGLLLT